MPWLVTELLFGYGALDSVFGLQVNRPSTLISMMMVTAKLIPCLLMPQIPNLSLHRIASLPSSSCHLYFTDVENKAEESIRPRE